MKPPIEITPLEWETIETYLDQITVSEKETMFSDEMVSIPNIEQKIEHVKKVRDEIEDSIRQSKIKEFHEHISVDKKDLYVKENAVKKTKPPAIWYSIAAVLVVLFGIFWMMQNTNSPEKIFAKNFKPDIGLPLKMGATNNLEFYQGMLDYKQGNYKNAIDQWQVLWKDNPENDTLIYFLGVANLAQGNAEKALEYLKKQGRFQHSIFMEDAAYYAALAHIKKGEFVKAKMLLKKNPSDRNTNLLKELEKE